MTTVMVESQIAAPVRQVFEVFTDVEHGAEHVSNIQKIELLTIGEFALGTRWRETREVMDHLDSAEMEVTAFERNRTYTITSPQGRHTDRRGVHVRAFPDRHQGPDRVRSRQPRAPSRIARAPDVGQRRQGAGGAQR